MLTILLPAFNEAENLEGLIRQIADCLASMGLEFQICLVDDGSTDSTASLATELSERIPLRLIRHPENLGLGRALLTGFTNLAREPGKDDVIIAMDSDGTHSPTYFEPLLDKIAQGFDVVVASRFAPGGAVLGVPFFRRALSRMAAVFLSFAYPVKGISDYTSGFRAYRTSIVADALDLYGGRLIERADFSCSVELLLKLLSLGAKAAEIPFQLRYDLKRGKSKLNLCKAALGYLWLTATLGSLRKK